LIKSLQVFSAGLGETEAASVGRISPTMPMVINPAASMSLGKQLAQIGHAVLMCARSSWTTDPRYSEAFAQWSAGGFGCEILPSAMWSAMRENADGVVVCDAGLTEVDPGTETVIALPPGFRAQSAASDDPR
jgi:peptidyl-tRNA hydrolase